jgi:signal transduction histidine kinase
MQTHKNIRVLIAEDDYLVREMIQGVLTELNYTVIGAAQSGTQAVTMTKELRPQVIIMDIQMPGMGGIEAARLIQHACPTPVVILTAYETPELVQDASEAGVNAYLIKPPNKREMERAITLAMARFDDMVKLRQMNEQLKAYNEELDAFAHTAAHDLQSPLGLIVGFSEVLLYNDEGFSPEKRREILTTITKTARKMSNIVDELLLLAGVRKMEVSPEPLDMGRVVHEAQQRLTDEIDDVNAVITIPDCWPSAMGYAPWAEEVWVNYLSNGLKYGGQPPCLELGAVVGDDGMNRFWVQDNGPGLSAADQEELFIPFTQLGQVRAKGHGLGLSIVRRIVERLDGSVGVDSQLGEGSRFWFTLPQVPDETV